MDLSENHSKYSQRLKKYDFSLLFGLQHLSRPSLCPRDVPRPKSLLVGPKNRVLGRGFSGTTSSRTTSPRSVRSEDRILRSRSDDLVMEQITVGDELFFFSPSFKVFEGFSESTFEFPQENSELVIRNKI